MKSRIRIRINLKRWIRIAFKISEFTTLDKNDLLEPGRWNLKEPREKEKVVPFFGIILKDCMFCVMCTVSICSM
jgi:hypothetical protein